MTVTGSGTVNILTKRKFGIFDHVVSKPTTFTWKKNDAALWMVTKGNIRISDPNERNDRVPVAWPRRTIYFMRRNSGGGRITLCTQLSIDRLPRLVHLSKTWQGPISAVLYIRGEEEIVQLRESWNSEDSMQKWVDVHVVYDDDKPWFRYVLFKRTRIYDSHSNITRTQVRGYATTLSCKSIASDCNRERAN